MMDDEEFQRVSSCLHRQGNTHEQIFGDFLREYERVTGRPETNPNAVFHHVLSKYGPPCEHCGRPLRTPRAKLCAACMKPATGPDSL
jgi:hypothetical protein